MLYLEDYLEMIENLPVEMRDRFTDMREMDLQVQNAMDALDDRVKTLFKKCATNPNLKQEWKDEQMQNIRKDYGKVLEDADEKVQMANQMHELVERHLRKLDQEVSKFKMELEADNAGITEVLEKRSLEMDKPSQPLMSHRSESTKRKYMQSHNHSNHAEKKICTDKMFSSIAHEAVQETLGPHRQNSAASSPSTSLFESSSSASRAPALAYNLGQVGAGSNAAISLAASRAIGATLGMQQGRRTSSLKASYEAVTKNVDLTKELTVRQDSTSGTSNQGRTETPSIASAAGSTKSARATKKLVKMTSVNVVIVCDNCRSKKEKQKAAAQQDSAAAAVTSTDAADNTVVDEGSGTTQWQHDPNEPRYCTCNDVSYGEMVGCDNDDCPIEWFHYACVGLTHAPKGKWFCPQCTAAMRRRGRK
ncbi:hypothetical protein CAPTEDRAFT_180978 [Capitella teleta]|uniref:Inhibitor of growth protein n=1 Tax=Capitella teleta TaxID=283909 RepID=R7TSH2_CAPTE|nr:hypothetical protein CAPTEDRAFT_180978 [Capitella teleta]|eukprot:ELT96557.1 hypothetical protein CAPTEDRAFT_180978 [Capitella teleta]